MSGDTIDSITFKLQAPAYYRMLLAGRLAIISFCMGVVVYYQAKYGELGDYIPALAPVGVAYFLTIIYALFLGRGATQRRFAYLQLFIDQVLVTWIVYSTGGLNSPFTFLYILVIAASVFFGPAAATYGLAGLASSLYCGLVILEHNQLVHPYHPFPPLADPKEFYYVFMSCLMNTMAFFFVAMMSSHLSVMLRRAGKELAQKIEDFTMLKAFHENVLVNMGLGFIAVGLDRTILSTNPAARRILRLREEEIIRGKIEKILGLESIKEYFDNISVRMDDERRFHWVYETPGGEDVYLSMSLNKFIVGGKIHGAIAVFQDVTEFKLLERSMAESERLAAIGKVAAIIAHEIRNPLASLSGSIQMLSSDLAPILDEHNARLMKITMREADRLNNIITDFLDFSSPANVVRREVSVEEIIGEVVMLLKSSPKLHQGVEMRITVEKGLVGTLDSERIKQVLWNIILNALDAMPKGGKLSIEAGHWKGRPGFYRSNSVRLRDATPGEWIKISVEDTGEGITDDVMGNIFEPFYTTKPSGTGLGLPSAKKIMESHGGGIEVYSKPGAGSSFVLWLPVIAAGEPGARPAALGGAPALGK